MIKTTNKIIVFLFFINILSPLIAMEEAVPTRHEETTSESRLLNLPEELKFHILTIGMADIIQNNSIFNPHAGISEYINLIGLICKDLRKFKHDLDNQVKKIVVEAFASNEKDLTEQDIDDKLYALLSGDYDTFVNLSAEDEAIKERKAASLIIARSYANQLGISLRYPNHSEYLPILAAIAKLGKYKKLIPLLLFYRANIDSRDVYLYTALFLAIGNQHEDIVKILLEKGADINARTYKGESILEIAQKTGNKNIISLVKKHQQLPKANESSSWDNFIKALSCNLY